MPRLAIWCSFVQSNHALYFHHCLQFFEFQFGTPLISFNTESNEIEALKGQYSKAFFSLNYKGVRHSIIHLNS